MERKTIRGVHFIRVRGDSVERARQHAALLREEIRQGALPALAKKNEWVIRRSPGITQAPPVRDAVLWLYRNLLYRHLARRNSKEMSRIIRAISDETGLKREEITLSLFQPDAFMLLCRLSVMKHRLVELPYGGIPGCTSAVALGGWTRSGRLLACRNQDYPLVGPWERNTTVVFHEPSERDQLPHVSVTTAGVHTAGLTAMNREGLTLFTHAHFGRHVTLRGTPIVDIGNEIVRKARTIGQAVDIARRARPYANWAFVVSSARENDAAVLEMTPRKVAVWSARDGFLSHSNYFHSRELQCDEALICGGVVEDVEGRMRRMREILEVERGSLEPRHLAAALGDQVDPHSGEERVVGNTVSVVTTVKSTVWDPAAQRFWVSSRHESPTGLGEFLEVDVDRFWKPSDEGGEAQVSRDSEEAWPVLKGYQPRTPGLGEAMGHYRDAYRAFHMDNHLPDYRERTLASLRKAARACPGEGNLWVQAGIMAFVLHEFREARECLERSRALKLSPHTVGVRDLYLARCLDLDGDRQAAVALYRTGGSHCDPKLREAMARGLKRPYRARETGRMLIDLQFPDTLQY